MSQTVVINPAASVALVCPLCIFPFRITVVTSHASHRTVSRNARCPSGVPYPASAFATVTVSVAPLALSATVGACTPSIPTALATLPTTLTSAPPKRRCRYAAAVDAPPPPQLKPEKPSHSPEHAAQNLRQYFTDYFQLIVGSEANCHEDCRLVM